MRHTPPDIHNLATGQIFVFGSNTAGIHGKGAARTAAQLFGAQKGVAEGPTGQCYAIPTRVYRPSDPENWQAGFSPVPLLDIMRSIFNFLKYAHEHPELEFLVTKIGCGYAGYKPEEIKTLWPAEDVPPNVVLPVEFR